MPKQMQRMTVEERNGKMCKYRDGQAENARASTAAVGYAACIAVTLSGPIPLIMRNCLEKSAPTDVSACLVDNSAKSA